MRLYYFLAVALASCGPTYLDPNKPFANGVYPPSPELLDPAYFANRPQESPTPAQASTRTVYVEVPTYVEVPAGRKSAPSRDGYIFNDDGTTSTVIDGEVFHEDGTTGTFEAE
jgi:hypothetical protein